MNLRHIFQAELSARKNGEEGTNLGWLFELPRAVKGMVHAFHAVGDPCHVKVLHNKQLGSMVFAPQLFVSSRDIAEVTQVTHFNVLRQLRSFARHNGLKSEIQLACEGGQTYAGYSGLAGHFVPGLSSRKTKSVVTEVLLWLPTFQAFVAWLLESLKHHHGTRARRMEALIAGFQGASGLTNGPSDLGDLLQQAFPTGVAVVNFPEKAVVSADAALLPDNLLQTIQNTPASGRVNLESLSQQLGYSVRQIQRTLATARAESPSTDSSFGRVVEDSVTLQTAIYLAMMMPKAVSKRMQVFSTLMQRLKPAPGEYAISRNGQTVDCGDAQRVQQFYLAQESVLEQERQQHLQVVADMRQRQDSLEAESRIAMAQLTAAQTEAGSLRAAMTTMTSQGSIMSAAHSDALVHSADTLRREHGMRGTQDVVKAILSSGVLKPDLIAKLLEPPARSIEDGVRLVLRFYTSHKYLNADGQPDLRAKVVMEGDARAFRVYVPNRSAVGAQAKHGVLQDWRWMVFFSPQGEAKMVEKFPELLTAWCDAERPKHSLPRVPQSAPQA